MKLKWVKFDPSRGFRQKLPKERRYVLVQTLEDKERGMPPGVGVGYLRFAAGDKQCPFFVIPAMGGICHTWCDCLGDDFEAPLWPGKQI